MGRKLIAGSVLTLVLAYYFSKSGTRKLGQVVETKNGKLQGIISLSRDGREFYEWLGVPYAKPPVGELRFASPRPADRWDGIREAYAYGPKCAQLEMLSNRIIGDEDCLHLNVHVPKIGKNDELPQGLPVMIFIHGGAFQFMSSDEFRPDYFMDEDVILVVTNYRVGCFGFFNTGDTASRGNMGLKDQALAMKWVNENIKAFGGDPNRVTIFGESAGAASTHYQMLSPSTRGLFSKVISLSGVATSTFALDSPEVAKRASQDFAESLGCKDKDTLKTVNCLRALSAEDLLRAVTPTIRDICGLKPQMKDHRHFRPTLEAVNDDEAFITEHPYKIVKEGNAHRVPWLTGVNADEGLVCSLEFHKDKGGLPTFEAEWELGIARTFNIPEDHKRLPEIAEKLRQFYFPNASQLTTEERIAQYTRMLSDSMFFLPTSHTAEMQRKYSPVHLYHYNQHGGPTLANLIVGVKEKFPLMVEMLLIVAKIKFDYYVFGQKPRDYGVCHADVLGIFFNMPGRFYLNKDDPMYPFSKDMVKLWTDFAKTEKNLSFRGVSLEQVKREGPLEYLELSENPKVIQEPFEDRIKFLKPLLSGVTIIS